MKKETILKKVESLEKHGYRLDASRNCRVIFEKRDKTGTKILAIFTLDGLGSMHPKSSFKDIKDAIAKSENHLYLSKVCKLSLPHFQPFMGGGTFL